MKNNQGFTLIELITTIALLSIIVIISFVSINKVIERGKKNNCQTLVNNIKTAAKEYVSDRRYKQDFISSVSDDSVSVSAATLINNNYLSSPITDPYQNDKNKTIDPNTINITLILNSDYTVKNATITGIECK